MTSDPGRKILFVRSGGGMPGLDIHAGITLALTKLGIESTHCIGTSAGAIISALDAAGEDAYNIADLIAGLRDEDVRDPHFMWRVRFWLDTWYRGDKVTRLIHKHVLHDFSPGMKPLAVCCTRNRDGMGVTFGHDSMRDDRVFGNTTLLSTAVLASMSIHGVFPDVRIGGEYFSDGGTAANVPLPRNWRDFDRVIICIASPPTEYQRKHNWITRLLRNPQWMMRAQINNVIREVGDDPRVSVIRPDIGKKGSALRFNHELIMQAYDYTMNLMG